MVRKIRPSELSAQNNYYVVDVRKYMEFLSGAIPRARWVPMDTLARAVRFWDRSAPLVTVCRTARRANLAAEALRQMGFENVAVLEGGMEAWRAAGLPEEKMVSAACSLQRQVRAGAGIMVLASTLLGLEVSPWFFAWSAFVGAGLIFAGVTDSCLMANLLSKLPWNKPRDQATAFPQTA